MEYLLHIDYLVQAAHAPENCELQKLCRKGGVRGWVLSCAVSNLHSILTAEWGAEEASRRIHHLLEPLKLLPVSPQEIRNALERGTADYQVSLAALAVRGWNLKGVVTLVPGNFNSEGVMACSPDEVVKLANAGGEPVAGVPLLNIPATYHEILENLEQEWMEVVRSGHYILGPKVSLLEERIAAFCGTPHAVGVSSGTDALLIALMAAGIGEGDEVITTPYTFFATAGSIARLGARPVFVDIDPETFNLQPDSVERAINSKTRAVMPVHLYGQCADMDAINRAAKAHGLSVIEDACQAIGARYKGRRAGALSDYGCFSFFPTKNLGGLGDGGMVTLGDPELFEKVRILRVHGSEPKYYHKMIGGNFRIDAIQAAGILAKLPFLERWTEKRRTNAKLYDRLFRDRGLDGKVGLPPEKVAGHVYNQYVIRAGSHRDALRTYLQKNKVMTEIYYPVPLHLQECFRYLGYGKGDFPEAEKAASETLALPISHELTPPQQEHVVNAIADFYS